MAKFENGMVAKTFSLEFSDLAYAVPDPAKKKASTQRNEKQIIHPTSGSVRPFRMHALMGASGAGKSTLLDILAGRLKTTSGSILVNGKTVPPSTFRKLSGYVMQQDALLPLFTVRETLRYAARLRTHLKGAALEQRVEDTLAMLHLTDAADTIIGDELHRGLSGGEKRRVSIGVDMIHHPTILFVSIYSKFV